jgi:hypothetical protein
MTTSIHTTCAHAQLTTASPRYAIAAPVIRALVDTERDAWAFDDGKPDPVADNVAEIMLHAFAILRERAGMQRAAEAPVETEDLRRAAVGRFLKIIERAARDLRPLGEPRGE